MEFNTACGDEGEEGDPALGVKDIDSRPMVAFSKQLLTGWTQGVVVWGTPHCFITKELKASGK